MHARIPAQNAIRIVELRRYRTQPGKRDRFIDLFERHLLDGQQAYGNAVIGEYRDLADADGFTWIRGFADMKARLDALEGFYRHSSIWKDHREEANSLLDETNNVLLLRAAREGSGFQLSALRPSHSLAHAHGSVVTAAIFALRAPASERFLDAFETRFLPALREYSGQLAYFVSEEEKNNFPALPVKEDQHAFVVIAGCGDQARAASWGAALRAVTALPTIEHEILSCESLLLAPTARSLFR